MLDRLAFFALAPLTVAGGLFGLPEPGKSSQRSFGVAAPKAQGGVAITRAADGLFYIPVTIGGKTVPMALDTGATRSVLPDNVPGVSKLRGRGGRIETLNGSIRFERAIVNDVSVGTKHFSRIEVAVVDTSFPAPLLGQDLLRRLGPVTIDGDTLTLR